MHYIVKSTPDTPNTEGDRVEFHAVAARAVELSGRSDASRYLPGPRKQRSYIATAKDSPGRALYGQGFIIEKVS